MRALHKQTNPPHVGTWVLPGGVIEAGEPPTEAAPDEFHEETGLDVSAPALTFVTGYAVAAPQGWYNAGYIYAVQFEDVSRKSSAGGDVSATRFWSLGELRVSDQELCSEPDDAAHIRAATDEFRTE